MFEISFEIPQTPENRKALDELKKTSEQMSPVTLYGQDTQGKVFPIMTITKDPKCPPGWYESVMRTIMSDCL